MLERRFILNELTCNVFCSCLPIELFRGSARCSRHPPSWGARQQHKRCASVGSRLSLPRGTVQRVLSEARAHMRAEGVFTMNGAALERLYSVTSLQSNAWCSKMLSMASVLPKVINATRIQPNNKIILNILLKDGRRDRRIKSTEITITPFTRSDGHELSNLSIEWGEQQIQPKWGDLNDLLWPPASAARGSHRCIAHRSYGSSSHQAHQASTLPTAPDYARLNALPRRQVTAAAIAAARGSPAWLLDEVDTARDVAWSKVHAGAMWALLDWLTWRT